MNYEIGQTIYGVSPYSSNVAYLKITKITEKTLMCERPGESFSSRRLRIKEIDSPQSWGNKYFSQKPLVMKHLEELVEKEKQSLEKAEKAIIAFKQYCEQNP